MNKYQIILFFLVFNASLKVWADSDSKNNPPQAVREAMQDMMFVSSEYGEGSGFVIRDDKNRAVLVTAYHVVREVIGKPDQITVKDVHRKKLRVKKVLSYSKRMDIAFLELEHYDRKGLKMADSYFDENGGIFVLGAFWNELHLTKGIHFNSLSKKFFNIITDEDFYSMRGFSGGPVLNEHGEVMGMLFNGHIFYRFMNAGKAAYMEKLLKSPKNKNSAVNQIPYNLYNVQYVIGRSNAFFNKLNFQRLQAMSNEGSFNAQETLKRLDMGQLIKLGVGFSALGWFALGTIGLLQAETLEGMLWFVPQTAFFGYISYNYCSDVFTHFKIKLCPVFKRIKKYPFY